MTKTVVEAFRSDSESHARGRERSHLEEEMHALLGVLNNNALAAALFLTMEVPLLVEPTMEYDDQGEITHNSLRLYAQLCAASIAVVLHGVCVFTACESTFVINHITHAFQDPQGRDEEYNRLRGTLIGSRIEPLSGFSYIFGVVAGMIALGSRLGSASAYGSPAGDIGGAVIGCCFSVVGVLAWKGVGGYVGGVHRRAAQVAGERTAQRDHRGRKISTMPESLST